MLYNQINNINGYQLGEAVLDKLINEIHPIWSFGYSQPYLKEIDGVFLEDGCNYIFRLFSDIEKVP